MDKKTLDTIETLFYNFGDVSKNIGRVETDGKSENMKKYEKLCKEREEILSEFRAFVKQCKAAWRFGVVAELAYAADLKSAVLRHVGSSPTYLIRKV